MTTGINKVLDKEPSIIKSKKNLKAFKGVHYKIDKKLQLYENGAHFKYSELCNKLEILLKSSEINTNCETALLTYSDKVNDNKSINKMLNIVNDDCPNGNRLNSVFNSKDSNKFKNISKRSVKNSKNASSKFASNKLLNAVTSDNNVLNVNTDLKTFDTYDSIKIETKKDLIDIKNNYDKKNISNNKNMISNSNLNIKKANKQNDNIKYNSTSIENNKTESYILNKNFKSIDKNISKNNTALQRENSKKNIIINSINSIKNISNIIVNKDNAGNTKLKEPMLKNNIKKIKVINKQPENLDIILPKINTGLKANTNTNNNTNKGK